MGRQSVFKKKLRNLWLGKKPKVLDLFAGCGGISLGFHSMNFQIESSVEYDQHAARTHCLNFHNYDPRENLSELSRDITVVNPIDIFEQSMSGGEIEEWIDVIVGGPPCQAFARVGRAKLREVAEHPEAFLNDSRGNLYLRYLEYVRQLKPLVILMENVPDVLNYGGHNISEETCEILNDLGYNCRYTLLNSVYYGVPQMRERMFLLGYAKELKVEPTFPSPTHWYNLPQGYSNSRKVATKTLKPNLFDEGQSSFFAPPPIPIKEQCKPAITVKEAISDLPTISEHLEGKLKRGARRFTSLIPYPDNKDQLSEYAKLMRNWPGFENHEGIKDHVIRSLPRDYKIFQRMQQGDQYPEAHKLAKKMLQEEIQRREKLGEIIPPYSEQYYKLVKEFVPPYDPGKFPNKWRKLNHNEPSRTLMAHLGKDSYSHIHYDDKQARTISVREAARLQSFPDGFIFSGTMNPAFRQIGNAVPPLMAQSLARIISQALKNSILNEKKDCYKEVDKV